MVEEEEVDHLIEVVDVDHFQMILKIVVMAEEEIYHLIEIEVVDVVDFVVIDVVEEVEVEEEVVVVVVWVVEDNDHNNEWVHLDNKWVDHHEDKDQFNEEDQDNKWVDHRDNKWVVEVEAVEEEEVVVV